MFTPRYILQFEVRKIVNYSNFGASDKIIYTLIQETLTFFEVLKYRLKNVF